MLHLGRKNPGSGQVAGAHINHLPSLGRRTPTSTIVQPPSLSTKAVKQSTEPQKKPKTLVDKLFASSDKYISNISSKPPIYTDLQMGNTPYKARVGQDMNFEFNFDKLRENEELFDVMRENIVDRFWIPLFRKITSDHEFIVKYEYHGITYTAGIPLNQRTIKLFLNYFQDPNFGFASDNDSDTVQSDQLFCCNL
jgi:hypothetical protein